MKVFFSILLLVKSCLSFRNMYILIKKRKELLERLQSLEEITKYPERLFKNRGGQLLQEEKERKTIQRVSITKNLNQ